MEIVEGDFGNVKTINPETKEDLLNINKNGDYHERLQKIKQRHIRAYEKWEDREKEILKRLFLNARKDNQLPTAIIKNLSEIFQRQPSAIRSQLRKEGFVKS